MYKRQLRSARSQAGYDPSQNVVHIFACGAMVPEALAAQQQLEAEGIFANLINVTGTGPLYHDFKRAQHRSLETNTAEETLLNQLILPRERVAPIVTVVDAHPHSLAWIGSALGSRLWPLGVVGFGQSGSTVDLYQEYKIDSASIVATCRSALRA